MFDDILERKKSCLDYEKQKVKTAKNWVFFKGVSPWLVKKKKKKSNDILERKKDFLDYKKQKVKKVKNWDFYNPWLWSKI